MMQPDVESGLKTIAVVSSSSSPNYAIELVGLEDVNGHETYHLRLRPLHDPQKHNLRDLWIDTQTFNLQKAHYLGLYTPGRGTSASDVTDFFTSVGSYWLVTHAIWTWTNPFDFREVSVYTFDVQTNAIMFPSSLPDWMFDSRAYDRRQRARMPDLLGPLLAPNANAGG
jgi:hypothetical protein